MTKIYNNFKSRNTRTSIQIIKTNWDNV